MHKSLFLTVVLHKIKANSDIYTNQSPCLVALQT